MRKGACVSFYVLYALCSPRMEILKIGMQISVRSSHVAGALVAGKRSCWG